MKSDIIINVLLIAIFCLLSSVSSLAEEKLQVLTTKKIENCQKRSKVGDTLYMQYTVSFISHLNLIFAYYIKGVLKSNGEKFDSSYDRGQPFVFKIGAQQAIKGWEHGLLK